MGRPIGIEDKVRELAGQAAIDRGVELASVELLGGGRRKLLRVSIDREGGVTLGDCEGFSRQIEALLDVDDVIQGTYTLEVSSPGLDRPLRNIGDFSKQKGKLARVITKEKIDNQSFFVGRIERVLENSVVISLPGGKEVTIALDNISRARLEVEIK